MQITTDTLGGRNVVFDYIHEDIPGGVSLDKTRLNASTTYIKAGTLVNVNKSTRVAEIVKTATVIDGGDANSIRVAKTHQFAVGEYVSDGLTAAAISSITTTEDDYDTLELGGSLVKYVADTVIYEVTSAAALGGYASATVEGAEDHTLTIYDPTGKAAGLKVVLAQAGSDTLAVAFSGGVLTISLADTTASKNTAALITTAIQALDATGYNFKAFYAVGSSWSETGGTLTTASDYMEESVADKYTVSGFVKDEVNVEYDNVDVSVVIRGAVREGSLPFPVTSAMKKELPLITFNA